MYRINRSTAIFMLGAFCFTLAGTGRIEALTAASLEDPAMQSVLWTFQTGGPVYNAAVIQDGALYIGSQDSNFYALNAETGAEIWRYKADNQVRTTAATDGEVICFGTGNQMVGLDFSGNLLWKTTLESGTVNNAFDAWDFTHSSPVIVDGIAYIGSDHGLLSGIDIRNGERVVQIQTPHPEYAIRTKPAIYNNTIFAGDWNGFFYAFDLSSGQLKWQFDTNPERLWNGQPSIQTDPAVINNTVLFSGRNCILYALNAATGEKVWQYNDPDNMWLLGGIALDDSMMCLGSSNQRLLHRINAKTGEVKWRQNLQDGRVFGTALVHGDYIYVGTGFDVPADGSLWMLARETGSPVARLHFNYQVQSSPAASGDVICFGCENGKIYAISESALLNMPRPKIGFDDESMDIGDLQLDETAFETSLMIYNTGEYPDSVLLSWRNTYYVRKNAVSINPSAFFINNNDSQRVTITIDASKFRQGSSSLYIEATSLYSSTGRVVQKEVSYSMVPATGIHETPSSPGRFALCQNYPNPFNPSTTIDFQIPCNSQVTLKIYNILGKEVASLVDGMKKKGSYSISWDGGKLNSGFYIYKLSAGAYSETRKMLLLR